MSIKIWKSINFSTTTHQTKKVKMKFFCRSNEISEFWNKRKRLSKANIWLWTQRNYSGIVNKCQRKTNGRHKLHASMVKSTHDRWSLNIDRLKKSRRNHTLFINDEFPMKLNFQLSNSRRAYKKTLSKFWAKSSAHVDFHWAVIIWVINFSLSKLNWREWWVSERQEERKENRIQWENVVNDHYCHRCVDNLASINSNQYKMLRCTMYMA